MKDDRRDINLFTLVIVLVRDHYYKYGFTSHAN